MLIRPATGFSQPDTLGTTAEPDSQNSTGKNQPDKNQDASLHIISDKMVAHQKSSMVEFIGNVKATRLDSIVYADSIQVYFYENSSKKTDDQSDIEKIISTGHVKYIAGDRKAFADKAVYTARDEILVLTGKAARLVTGSNFVTGKKITLYRLEDKVIVESDGTNQVEALFTPKDDTAKKNETQDTQASEDKPEKTETENSNEPTVTQ